MATCFNGNGDLLGENYHLKNIGIITRKYIGKSFKEYNCLQLLHYIYKDLDIEFPSEYKEYTLTTYMKYWENNPRAAEQDLIALFNSIGSKVNTQFLKRGDAVIIKHKHSIFPAIYLGDNTIMASSIEQGVITIPIGTNYKSILARRF